MGKRPWDTVQRIASQTLGYLHDARMLRAKVFPIGCTQLNPTDEAAALHTVVLNNLANPVNVITQNPVITQNTPQGVYLPGIESFSGVLNPIGIGVIFFGPWIDITTETSFTLFASNTGPVNPLTSIIYNINSLPGGVGFTMTPPGGAAIPWALTTGLNGVTNCLGVAVVTESLRHKLQCGSFRFGFISNLGTQMTYTLFINKQITP